MARTAAEKRFKSPGQAQRFLAAHDQIGNLFHPCRYRLPAAQYRAARTRVFRTIAVGDPPEERTAKPSPAEVTGVAARA